MEGYIPTPLGTGKAQGQRLRQADALPRDETVAGTIYEVTKLRYLRRPSSSSVRDDGPAS